MGTGNMSEKTSNPSVDDRRRGIRVLSLALVALAVLLTSVLGVVTYVCYNEIISLKGRVATLEIAAWAGEDHNLHITDQKVIQDLLVRTGFLEPLENRKQGKDRQRRQVTTDYTLLLQQFAAQEMQVLQTFCTNSTKICVRGQPGHKGEVGLPGFPGTKGNQGHYGISGPVGPRGDDGLPGGRGPKGEPGRMTQGMTGPKGDKGDRGKLGPPGPKGTAPLTPPVDPNKCCNNLARPHFLQTQTNTVITAPFGSSVTLPCLVQGSPKPELLWRPAVDPLSLGRYVQVYNGMNIDNVKYTDTMTFVCRALNIFGTVEQHIQLVVTDKVTAAVIPPQTQVNGGPNTNVDIVCSYTGTPTPNVTWVHVLPGGKTIPVTSLVTLFKTTNESTLHVTGAGPLDGGLYQCVITNAFESQTSTANLTVISRPGILTGPLTQTVTAGQTIVLRCDVIANPPATVIWTYPHTGTAPPKDVTVNPDGSITIHLINSFNQGRYQCSASNNQGTTTAAGDVTVISPVTVSTSPQQLPVHAGDKYSTITCTGTGNPTPSLSWTNENGAPITSSGGKFLLLGNGELIITNVDPDGDSGVYTCTANNGNETAITQTILYNDLGAIPCTMRFADCTTVIARACGGRCPTNCRVQGGTIFGYKQYTMQSLVCLSAQHTGSGNDVIWHVVNGRNTYEAKTSNGIPSYASGPHAESAEIWINHPSVAQPASVPIIG